MTDSSNGPLPHTPHDLLDERIDMIASDRSSGAMELAVQAAELFAIAHPDRYLSIAQRIIQAQPCMAPLFRVANDALLTLEANAQYTGNLNIPCPDKEAWQRVNEEFRGRFKTCNKDVTSVVTFSWSSTVYAWLAAARESHPLQIFLSEARPQLEGRLTAKRLVDIGHSVTFFTDAYLPSVISQSDIVLLGADAITSTGAINKSGSYAVALSARQAGIPCVMVASSQKLLPPQLERLGFHIPNEQPGLVWHRPPKGVTVRNPLFENVPHQLINGFLLDLSYTAPESVLESLQDIPISTLWESTPHA